MEDMSEKNKANRAKQLKRHTVRSKSYAQIQYEQVRSLLLLIFLYVPIFHKKNNYIIVKIDTKERRSK